MRIGTKILLLMLLITIGSSAIVSWIVEMSVTRYETGRANDEISLAIRRYLQELGDHYQQINHVVQVMLGDPALRSLLAATDEPGDAANAAREQLSQEVFGHDVQLEVQAIDGKPVFHVLINLAHEVLFVALPHDGSPPAPSDRNLVAEISAIAPHWPIDQVINSKSKPVMKYIATPSGLFLVMGVPLYEELDQPPSHAYFTGFRIDDDWIHRQMLAESATGESTLAPLDAAVVVNDRVVARGSNDSADQHFRDLGADTPLVPATTSGSVQLAGASPVRFTLDGERFVGQSIQLDPQDNNSGRLLLASSLDRALAPLHKLQESILLTALVACVIAVIVCRLIAQMIAKPINELVAGTRRIGAGEFDEPVRIHRRDELGVLAASFNQMSQGLKERDSLRAEKIKIEHDMALARKIQMDVLPKALPPCPGYDMAAFSLPAEQTGGDIYDLVAVALDPQEDSGPASLVLLLADATGHGIGPAISVTQVRSMLRIGVRLRADLEKVFGQINRQLCQDLGSDRFVTAFLGLLDPSNHCISYQSAGQGPLLHFHAKNHRFEWLDASMPPLGVDEDAASDSTPRMRMEPGDLIILLTDGFFEFQNPERELFGRDKVAEIILKHHHQPARELLNCLLEGTKEFARGAPQMDDMTALIIRRLEPVE
jgi:serine phosphatase RsbU (regulator of sigma subunit)